MEPAEPLLNNYRPENEVIEMTQTSSSLMNNTIQTLKERIKSNDLEYLGNFNNRNLLNYVHNCTKPILIWALTRTEVTSATIGMLLDKGALIDYVDPEWYGWEPLHYAARAANPSILQTIVGRLPLNRINSLTNLSENALHVLLEHGIHAQSLDISRKNGTDLKMSKIINQEHQDIVSCAKILLDGGIDFNHNNFWNETPLLVALKRKYYGVVDLLLKKEGIDLDSCREAVSKRTARELLKGKEERFGVLPRQSTHETPQRALFRLLKSGDEEGFRRYNGGRIMEYANATDGSCDDNSSCTLLGYCFRRGLIIWYKEKRKGETDYHKDITAQHLVQVFCQSGMGKCIEHLLLNGADPTYTRRKFKEPLLEVAVVKGYYPLVGLLLGRDNPTGLSLEECVTIYRLLQTRKTSSDTVDVDNTLTLLLTKLLSQEKPLDLGEVAHVLDVLAKEVRNVDKGNILLMLRFPGAMCSVNSVSKKSVLEEIDPGVIQTHLDECVEQEDDKIYINYSSFIKYDKEATGGTRKTSTINVLETFLNSPVLNQFFNHLVFKILINRKWENLHHFNVKYFYCNLYFYILFYITLNVYILYKFNNVTDNIDDTLYWINVTFTVIFTLKELAQVAANFSSYFTELVNYPEIFFIAMTIWTFCAHSSIIDIPMVLTVLSSNLVLLLLLEQVPRLARYIIILRTVVFYLKYIVFYFIQFIAFAICFYILFSQPNQVFWTELPNKIFETVVIFTGSFEFMDTKKFEKREPFAKIVFILFVLFMAIILNNLLLGLLVTDMSNLSDSVKLYEQMKRAGFVVRLEGFFESKVAQKFPLLSNLSYKTHLFDKDEKYLEVTDADRKMLDDAEKQYLDFILVKKSKRPDQLERIYKYLARRISGTGTQVVHHEFNKEVLQKLQLIEEKLKILQEMHDIVRAQLDKN